MLVVFYGRLSPENEHAHEASPSMAVPLILLAILAVGFGFIAIDYTSSYGRSGPLLRLAPLFRIQLGPRHRRRHRCLGRLPPGTHGLLLEKPVP